MTLPDSIRLTHPTADYPVFEVNHAAAFARVSLQGAQMLEWTPAGQEPVLYLSPQAVFQPGKAIRGGVPICWPWFGPHETNAKLPSHGFVRNRFWKLSEAAEDEAGVRMVFTFQDDAETHLLWPHCFEISMELRIGAELKMALAMRNTGDAEFTITSALHTYLSIGHVSGTVIEGLDGARYLDTVGEAQIRTQKGDILIDHELDRNYHASGEVSVKDASLGRTITVRGGGSQCTVVWNPWIEKAAALADMPDQDYQRFVCVETANAWEDRITLEPNASHRLATTLALRASAATTGLA
jgi:glucose-6-phosphate 1-epimerase